MMANVDLYIQTIFLVSKIKFLHIMVITTFTIVTTISFMIYKNISILNTITRKTGIFSIFL